MTTQRRDLVVGMVLDDSGFDRRVKSAADSARVLERELAKQEAAQRRVNEAYAQTGRVMVGAGLAIAGAVALSTRVAVQWESDWAGVAKVLNDATVPQLEALEGQLRGLTHELPQSHQEIAAVASAAGQLGIRAQDIAEFTRTMIDLGVSTNLSSQEAAFALARISTIMGTLEREGTEGIRRLGSTIVELGNNSATTEGEIVEMALRISGAGRVIGLSEAQVLGFAAAVSSTGVQAQAGGTAISRVFTTIEQSVRSGGQELANFAEVAGMSATDFRRAYQDDAGQAIDAFVAGLGRIQASGGDVFATLETLGFSEIRVRDALLRMAGAGDILTRSLEIANRGWDENTALLDEAERRYGTVEARMQIARNQVNDFAIDVGNTLLPALGNTADFVGNVAGVLADLPGPLTEVVTVIAAVTGGALLLGGTALITVPKVAAFRQSLDLLAMSSGRAATAITAASTAMGRASSFLFGPWGLAIGAAITVLGAFALQQGAARARAQEFTDTLDDQTGKITENTRALIAHKLEEQGALEVAKRYGIELSTLVDAVLGSAEAQERLNAAVAQHGGVTELTSVTGEYTGEVAELRKQVLGLSGDLEEGQARHERVTEAIGETDDATRRLEPNVARLADQFGLSVDQAAELAGEINDLDAKLRALFDSAFGLQRAEDALTEGFRRLTEQVEQQTDAQDKNAGSLKGNSQAAIDNRRTIEDLIEKHGQVILKMDEEGATAEDVAEKTDKFREKLLKKAEQLGINVEELDDYLAVLAEIPEVVGSTVTVDTSRARLMLDQFNRELSQSRGFAGFEVRHSGGFIGGSAAAPQRERLVLAEDGEFMVRRPVAERNAAALEFANRTGARLQVAGHDGAAAAAPGGAGVHVENLHMHAWSDRFSAKQVEDELAFSGAV